MSLLNTALVPCVCLALLVATACGFGGGVPEDAGAPALLIAGGSELLRRDGGGQRVLVSFEPGAIVRAPALSPDGRRLAFVLQTPAGRDAEGRLDFGADLYVANADGSGARRLLKHGSNGEFFDTPRWLPDGETLVFAVRGLDATGKPDHRAESLHLPTMQRRRLFDGPAELTLTPDGRHAVFVRAGLEDAIDTLDVASLDGSDVRILVPVAAGLTLMASPAVAPDGRRVAFVAAGGSSESGSGRFSKAALHPTLQDVWVVDLDGGNLHKLADLAQTRLSLAWSADAATLYVIGEDATWRVDARTGEHVKIGPGSAWSNIALAR